MREFVKLIKKIDYFFYKKLYSEKSNFFIDLFSKIGNFFSIAFFLLIMLILPFQLTKKIFIISCISLFYSTIIVFILKYSFKRKRIYNDKNLKSKIDPYAFPSGHVSRLASLIIPNFYIFPIFFIFIISGLFVSILRMKKGYHYFSDCVVGYIIGFLCGGIAVLSFEFIIPK